MQGWKTIEQETKQNHQGFKMQSGPASENGDNKPGLVHFYTVGYVLEKRPDVTWDAVQDAEAINFEVFDKDEKRIGEPQTLPGNTNHFKLPKDLLTGHSYQVQVSALKGDKTLALSHTVIYVLAARRLPEPAMPSEHLAQGDAYCDFGLLDEAKREYSAIPPGDRLYAEAQQRIKTQIEKKRRKMTGQD